MLREIIGQVAFRKNYFMRNKGKFRQMWIISTVVWLFFGIGGCSFLKVREEPAPESALLTTPLTPEESQEVLSQVGDSWLYGQGFGTMILTIGTSIFFPPYALYVAGNAALSLSGYEPFEVTRALPEEAKVGWDLAYTELTSVPGRVTAAVSGNEFITREESQERLRTFLNSRNLYAQQEKEIVIP